ncbi:MAG: hypothetical protein P8L85_20355 [Rubripirellula sp.]|nr:hypothetical protein [Rubripirellula sp.]
MKKLQENNPYQPPGVKIDQAVRLNDATPTGIAWLKIWLVAAASLFVGVISRLARELVRGPIHFEAIAATVVQIALVLAVIYTFRRWRLRDGIINVNLAITMIWWAFLIGWTFIHRKLWDDFIFMVAIFWLGSVTIGSLLIYFINYIRTKSRRES